MRWRRARQVTRVARSSFDHINEARRSLGLKPVQWDSRVAEVALAHSRDMHRNQFFGHTSPNSGEVADRFQVAGVKAQVVRENLARGYGPREIHDGFMGSPGHRAAILAADVTHVGIGVVIGSRGAPDAARPLVVTQNFYAAP